MNRVFLSRLRGLVRGRHLDRDLQDEINAHLDEATHEYRLQGLSHEDARRAALRSFGGVAQVQEVHRDMRSFPWLEDARRDIHYALRSLKRTPGFAVVAILTLALAIGAATAIFSVTEVALLRPVPYEKPEEIVAAAVGAVFERRVGPSVTDIELWRGGHSVFARIGMGRLTGSGPVVVDAGVDARTGAAAPERVTVGTASEDFLEVFGIFSDPRTRHHRRRQAAGISSRRPPWSPVLADPPQRRAGCPRPLDSPGRRTRHHRGRPSRGLLPRHRGLASSRHAIRVARDARIGRPRLWTAAIGPRPRERRPRAHCTTPRRRPEARVTRVGDVAV